MNRLKKRNEDLKLERLEMFSDGVFAIAITLLILEIKIPKHEQLIQAGGLYNYLLQLWPSYLAYALSFLFVGIYWSNHHWLFSYIKKTNHVFNMLNLLFLMTISFFPFTTAIFGDFIMDHEFRNAAVTAWCVGLFLPIIPVIMVYLYATHKHRLVDPKLSKAFIKTQRIKLFSGVVFCGTAIGLSFNYPMAALILIFLLEIIYLFPPDTPVYEDEKGLT